MISITSEKPHLLLIAIGLSIIVFVFAKYENSLSKYKGNERGLRELENSLKYQDMREAYALALLNDKNIFLSNKIVIERPILIRDSIAKFKMNFEEEEKYVEFYIEIAPMLNNYRLMHLEKEILKVKLFSENSYLIREKKSLKFEFKFYFLLGIIFLIWGVMKWLSVNGFWLHKNNLFCQSCARKFSGIVTKSYDSDGCINNHFCKECYANGDFTEFVLDVNSVVQRFEGDNFKRSFFTKTRIKDRIRQLDRWKKNHY